MGPLSFLFDLSVASSSSICMHCWCRLYARFHLTGGIYGVWKDNRTTQLAVGSWNRQEIPILLRPILTIALHLDLLYYYQPRAGYVPKLWHKKVGKTVQVEWHQTRVRLTTLGGNEITAILSFNQDATIKLYSSGLGKPDCLLFYIR